MNYSIWRYIPPIAASGAVQMAVDVWLLEQHRQGNHPPTLRFYTWKPIALSLGHHQRRYPDAWRNLSWQGQPIELVRRPSGGRAVLHQGELTYAVITSGIPGTRLQAYRQICQFLIQGWRAIGIDLHYGEAGRGYIHNPNCFDTATSADLVTTDGIKLIGSAQLRRDTVILQHGSMQLMPDPTLFRQVFGVEIQPIALPNHLKQNLHHQVIQALLDAACTCFDIRLEARPLSETEWERICSSDCVKQASASI
ncbi:lipoate--protein ligase family protein [Thermocoleostomius sinensis]|uniref:Biotin/lipoate A/B protein ligase family protein n=1 Tax=Thermocoleostomius sinensis A174 TaxID=2016057 RepID=A0A9E8ZAT1_9CYAN|nr:biotin/lipoate A/B protein ligase family protein [Thermocoleostomius sinensis]WAL59362.1 biotin/lipoate A/B protein ligase family protein [Thermocoleostomius sinensis A174]